MATSSQQQTNKRGRFQNIRLPLIGSFTNRDSSPNKDQRFVNVFPETRKVESIESTKIFLNKRPGLDTYKTIAAGEGRGLAWFRSKFYLVIGNKVYEDGTSPTSIITMSTSTGPVGIINGNSASLGDYLFICDGTNGWVVKSDGSVITISNDGLRAISVTAAGTGFADGTYNCGLSGGGGSGATATYTTSGGAITEVTVTNPGTGYTSAPTVSFPSGGGSGAIGLVYLNAFPTPHIPTPTFIDGYVILAQRSDVYNCVLDEPQHWDSSNYLTAEMFPDAVVSLARQNNQVVVFGETSTEFFYDAANASGSPLSRNESTTIQLGCAFPYAVYQNEKTCIFVGQSDSGGRAVWQIEGFQPKKISDEFIDRIIDSETSPTTSHGFGLRTMGHLFYVVHLPTLSRTFVYDVEEKLWHEWSSLVSGTHVKFAYSHMADNHLGKAYLLHDSTGTICVLNPNTYTDSGTNILVEIVTNKFDMDTYRRKFISGFRLVGDRYSVASANSITLYWSDDDYQTWSNGKVIALWDGFPNFARLGSFRRRAFKIIHQMNNAFRAESIEVDYVEGDS